MTREQILDRLVELREQQAKIVDELNELRRELAKILAEERHGSGA